MRLQNEYATRGIAVDPVSYSDEPRKKRLVGNNSAIPDSWKEDRVSISAEARAISEANAAKQPPKVSTEQKDAPEEEMNPLEEFAAYMEKKRSKAQGASYEEKLKSLQEKLKSLESQLSQVVTDKTDDGAKAGKIQNLTTEISSVLAQIAELSSRAAEERQMAEGGKE